MDRVDRAIALYEVPNTSRPEVHLYGHFRVPVDSRSTSFNFSFSYLCRLKIFIILILIGQEDDTYGHGAKAVSYVRNIVLASKYRMIV